jgi:hypothetical protein
MGEHGADEGVDFAVVGAGGRGGGDVDCMRLRPDDGGKGWMWLLLEIMSSSLNS